MAGEEELKGFMREAAMYHGTHCGCLLTEHIHNMFHFTLKACSPPHQFTIGVRGNTIWATDNGIMFVSGVLISRGIRFDWKERAFADKRAAREAFIAA